jgi:hypothetical protein
MLFFSMLSITLSLSVMYVPPDLTTVESLTQCPLGQWECNQPSLASLRVSTQ